MDTIEKVNQMIENDPRWITGKRPNEPGKYLTTTLWCGEYNVSTHHFNEKWDNFGGDVIAWMPMPPAYIQPKKPAEKKCENCFRFTNGSCMVCSNDSEGKKTMVSSTDPLFGCKHWKERENE